jgi:imidazole glycerol-phosphate synthase subunit HisH
MNAPGVRRLVRRRLARCAGRIAGPWYPYRVRIVVCDVGLGNLRSVERAAREASRGRADEIEVSGDPRRLTAADKVIVPGQAAFGDCVRGLEGGLGEAILAHLAAERPYLGICLGLQVLFASSEEAPGCRGLGVLAGSVIKLRGGVDTLTGQPLKIPHMGWNVAERVEGNRSKLLPEGKHFYFVHSYVVAPADPRVVAATTEYGERFVSAIAYGNVFASQFHPEKSQRAGLALLERFLAS